MNIYHLLHFFRVRLGKLLVGLIFLTLNLLQAQVIEDLGNFWPLDLSADGSVLIGWSSLPPSEGNWETKAAIRQADGEVVQFQPLEGWSGVCDANAISGDGLVVVGSCGKHSFRWQNGVLEDISPPSGQFSFPVDSAAYATNYDGSIIYGTEEFTEEEEGEFSMSHGYRLQAGVYTFLPEVEMYEPYDEPVDTTADGSQATYNRTGWTSKTGIIWGEGGFSELTGESDGSSIYRISADGNASLVSFVDSSVQSLYYRDQNGNLIKIDDSADGTGISQDGEIAVGLQSATNQPFLWTKEAGTRDLDVALTEDYGIDTTGWEMQSLSTLLLSDDGSVLIGVGKNLENEYQAWRVSLPVSPLKVELLVPSSNFNIDEPIEATVEVTSRHDELITVSFPNGLLTTDDESLFEITAEDIEPFDLTPVDRVKTFTVLVIPRLLGSGELMTTAESMVDGELISESASATLTSPSLNVSLKALPLIDDEPIVNMKLIEVDGVPVLTDESGNPISPKVEVTIENLGNTAVNAFLQGLDPRARDESAVLGRITTVGDFPLDLGTLEAGASVTREIDLEVFEDGRFEFTATATGSFGGGATFATASQGAPIAVGETYPVQIEIELANSSMITKQNRGALFVQPGGFIQVVASVNNLTTNSTLKFYGIEAEKSMNVQGGDLTNDRGELKDPPFVFDHEVEANASVVLGGQILTSNDGAPSGTLRWLGLEDAILVDDLDGEERELRADDILVTSTVGGWLGDKLKVRVIQDYSQPPSPPALTFSEGYVIYTSGAILGMGEWTYDSFDAIGGLGRLAGNISGNPSLLADAWGEGSRAVWETSEMLASTWSNMSESQKEEFVLACAYEVGQRLSLYISTRSPVDANDFPAVYDWTLDATYSLFDGVTEAYASNDPAQIADMWGRVSGNAAMEVATSLIPDGYFVEFAKAAELTKLAKNKAFGAALTEQEALLRNISGSLDSDLLLRAHGVGESDKIRFQEIFKMFGVKGYARERSPISYHLINEIGEAVWKPENMKPKGFSNIDLLLIGEPAITVPGLADSTRTLDLEGITGIFWPESDHVIRNRLGSEGYSAEVIEAAVSRAKMRREEFQTYAPKFREWKEDKFSVALNYKDNGVPNPVDQKDVRRDFDFEINDRGLGKPLVVIPKLANQSGDFRYISGDIDWVHFSFLDGSPLDPDTARKLYDVLTRCCGMQHPETISWIRNGQTVFKAKANQLVDYIRGKKALLEISGDSVQAVHVNEEFTRFVKNGRDHLIFFDNGLKSRQRASDADIETAFAHLQKLYPKRVLLPFLWTSKINEAGQDTSINGNDWAFDGDDPDALVLREGENGSPEIFDGSQWLPLTLPTASSFSEQQGRSSMLDAPLSLAPATSTLVDVTANTTTVPIVDLPELWGDELSSHVERWFEVGDTVILAAGELSQEVHVIQSLDPLTLVTPLAFDHPKGTTISVVPQNLIVYEISSTASELVSVVIEDNQATLIWTTVPDRLYDLEVLVEGSRRTIRSGQVSDSLVTPITIPLSEYDESAIYRLRDTTIATEPLVISTFVVDPSTGTLSLTWTSQPSGQYLIDVTESLGEDSWASLLPAMTDDGVTVSAVLPLSTEDVPNRFFRVRSPSTESSAETQNIIGMSYDETSGMLTVTWSTLEGETYLLESNDFYLQGEWETEGDAIVADGAQASLLVPVATDAHSRIFRVRELSP